MYFDTHAHYDDKAFDEDRAELLASMGEGNVSLIVNPGIDLESSRTAVGFAEKYDFMYAAVGYHPEDIAKFSEDDYAEICTLAEHPKCVAIGEIGLDYYWDDTHKQEQKEIFKRQIELALKLNKPVIIHDREAHGDCFEIISQYPELRGVFHCYSGSAEDARTLVKMGWMLSFNGAATFKNARKAPEVIAEVPMERLMIETDAPYLAPVPHRGKRNDSSLVYLVAEKIAQIKGLSAEEVENTTWENGKRFFRIP